MSFDQLSAISLAPGRRSSRRYEHIYFLDRSRSLLSIFSKICDGPGDAGPKLLELRLRTRGGRSGFAPFRSEPANLLGYAIKNPPKVVLLLRYATTDELGVHFGWIWKIQTVDF